MVKKRARDVDDFVIGLLENEILFRMSYMYVSCAVSPFIELCIDDGTDQEEEERAER